MPQTSSSRLKKATGHDVGTGKVISMTVTMPDQLSLFRTFLPAEDADSYSNTIELYDAMPKYFSSKKRMAEERGSVPVTCESPCIITTATLVAHES